MQQQTQPQPILSVVDLHWHINNKLILQNINVDIAEGEVVGLIGPNGAGKSSLLRCLYRYLPPSSGSVQFHKQDIWQISAKDYAKQVAVVSQDNDLHLHLTLFEMVMMGCLPYKSWFEFDSQADKDNVEQALNKVGLYAKMHDHFDSLSGGEKQRALIARAIVQQSNLLIMDEPTSHLDVQYQIQILELAKSLDITVIVSIHDLNLAAAFCDQLLVLDKGCLVQHGTPTQVLTEQLLLDVFGLNTRITSHPYLNIPQVCYLYGQQTVDHKEGAE